MASANIVVAGTDTLPSWATATTSVKLPGCAVGPPACDSVHVGLIGITTVSTPVAAMPSHVAPFEFIDEAMTIDRWVPRLIDEGADFVIVVAHEGARCAVGPAEVCEGPMIEVASRLRHPPHLIVSGHSHTLIDISPSGVPVVQGMSYGTHFTVVDLERIDADSVEVQVHSQPIVYADAVVPDDRVEAIVAAHEAALGSTVYERVSTLREDWLRRGPEYPLGNLIADAQRRATGTQVAIMNNGGIRTDLAAGEVRYDDLFRLQPFGNTLVTMTLSGTKLVAALEHALRGGRAGAHVSGLRVQYLGGAAEGQRIRQITLDSGEVVIPAGSYTVTANNFLVDGGDGFTMLREGSNSQHTGILDLDALIAHLRALPVPPSAPQIGRFTPID